MSGVVCHCLLISVLILGQVENCREKKCMFNYFLEHAGSTVLPLCVQVRIQNVLENTKAVFKQNCVWKLKWWNWAVLENWELASNMRKWTEAVLQWQRKKQREGWIAFSFLWENSYTKLKVFWNKARIKGHDNILVDQFKLHLRFIFVDWFPSWIFSSTSCWKFELNLLESATRTSLAVCDGFVTKVLGLKSKAFILLYSRIILNYLWRYLAMKRLLK